jgi:acyl dehydratase
MSGAREFPVGDGLAVGDALPSSTLAIAARQIVMGAAASRDWQPQHHDRAHAIERMKLPDIIANTPTQAGWLSRYVTDWSGPRGRIARLRFRMLDPICPGATLTLRGRITALARAEQGWWWVWLALSLARDNDGAESTRGELLLALPAAAGAQPWRAPERDWQPPALLAVASD